ncbi:MAG: FliA/WhiG family RNA polymerase sigma factor [Bdellovibrionales bacterium]|nr:FliA/WhiG family RNA polymerase sigma factor [Bdellovibrionales bacterium]
MKSAKILKFDEAREKLKQHKKKASTRISLKERNKIIVQYMPMIHCIAKKISIRLPSHIECDDLISNGVIGLMDAIEKYDPNRDNKFKTYAEFRVRGAILDALRSQDWIPRSIRDKTKKLNKITQKLELELGRVPEDHEVAKALSITLEEFYALVNQTRPVNILSIDETAFFSRMDKRSIMKLLETKESILNRLNRKSVNNLITNLIQELPERQRMVLSLYYYEGFNLKKIGQILKVTESRISQLHAQAIERLKSKLFLRLEEKDLDVAS